MSKSKKETEQEIKDLELEMQKPDFWSDKNQAQETIKKIGDLKDEILGFEKYDKGSATLSILSGAGGDDAEDFSRILFSMYQSFIQKNKWEYKVLHENKNDHGGYRNITIEIIGKGVYGILKYESGVHRLVRLSPFNSKKQRHTSFCLVDVLPDIGDKSDVVIDESDLKIEFSKSSGPGGQNVNKRETAVRIVHIPTNISVHIDSERTQEANREKALKILKAKLTTLLDRQRKEQKEELQTAKTTEIEWGNQIRSYVLHPYKMVKDHRCDIEVRDVDSVIERGDIEPFIEAMKNKDSV